MSLLYSTDKGYDSLHDSDEEGYRQDEDEGKESKPLPPNISRRQRRVIKYKQKQKQKQQHQNDDGYDGDDEFGFGGRKKTKKRKVRKKGTKKKARRRIIYKSKATKRFIDTFNIKKRKKNRKYPFTRGNLFYLNKKSHGKRITSKIISKYPKAFNLKLRKRFLK